MATYRVGEAGATVFDSEGRVLVRLRPGNVVVAGSIDSPGSLAEQHHQQMGRPPGYADKKLRPTEGKG